MRLGDNGNNRAKARKAIEHLDNSHFGPFRKYPVIYKTCPVCGKVFKEAQGKPREKTTCSHACSNTHFRSGEQNPNWRESQQYRVVCYKHHERKCIVCGEKNLVEVHHMDEDNKNNEPANLAPLCPTHHRYMHSKYKYLIEDRVKEYLENFK
jgi:hypothetical protein